MTGDALLQTVEELFDLLDRQGAEYLLVGGIALLQYVEGRNTEDIDLIISLPALNQLPDLELLSQDRDFARATFRGLQLNTLLPQNPLFAKVRRDYATVQPFREREIPCATVEGLLLLKLYALPSLYRQADFARVGLYENDIATLMHYYQPNMEPLLAELTSHLSATDCDALREIVAELCQRMARFRRGLDTSGESE